MSQLFQSVWWLCYGLESRRIRARYQAKSKISLFQSASRPASGRTSLSPWEYRLFFHANKTVEKWSKIFIYIYHTVYERLATATSFPLLRRCRKPRAMASSFLRFLDHTQRRTTVGRTPLDEWSAGRRDLYLTTRNTHLKHPPPARFEPGISAQERTQNYTLDHEATGTDLATPLLLYTPFLA
jgi:hypothetical protein